MRRFCPRKRTKYGLEEIKPTNATILSELLSFADPTTSDFDSETIKIVGSVRLLPVSDCCVWPVVNIGHVVGYLVEVIW